MLETAEPNTAKTTITNSASFSMFFFVIFIKKETVLGF